MTNIAFLGLGNMGGPMAANLVAAGHTVHGFDPVPALKEAAEAKGVKVFDSGAAAVTEADVVISSLPNGAVVKACYDEVLPAAKPGALFIDTSTISVADARDIHKQAIEAGFAQLDAPVSGGVKGATAGTLAFMVGGEDEAVERARPGTGTVGGQDHSLRWLRQRTERQAVQQHGAGSAADRRRGSFRVGRETRPVGAVAVRRDHRSHRQLLVGAHQLSGARAGPDFACQ